jgi:hypothetical protein
MPRCLNELTCKASPKQICGDGIVPPRIPREIFQNRGVMMADAAASEPASGSQPRLACPQRRSTAAFGHGRGKTFWSMRCCPGRPLALAVPRPFGQASPPRGFRGSAAHVRATVRPGHAKRRAVGYPRRATQRRTVLEDTPSASERSVCHWLPWSGILRSGHNRIDRLVSVYRSKPKP